MIFDLFGFVCVNKRNYQNELKFRQPNIDLFVSTKKKKNNYYRARNERHGTCFQTQNFIQNYSLLFER